MQVLYPDLMGNGTSAIEFIIEMVNGTQQPTIKGNCFPGGNQVTAYVGIPISCTFEYDSPSGQVTFMTQPTNLPPGMTFTPSPSSNQSDLISAPGEAAGIWFWCAV